MHTSFSAYKFKNIESLPFKPEDYSRLKFGSDMVAKNFGYELANKFFEQYKEELINNIFVVLPCPYNYVKNAASLITEHFITRINTLLVHSGGRPVQSSLIHREMGYIADYGFLSKEVRKSLLDSDNFYFNTDFISNKKLIIIDDVKITGTHEEKLVKVLKQNQMENDVFFLYYGEYEHKEIGCDIEAKINFAAVQSVQDYITITNEPRHQIIVRAIKYMLSQKSDDFAVLLDNLSDEFLRKLYHLSLSEGYYNNEAYKNNLTKLYNFLHNQ